MDYTVQDVLKAAADQSFSLNEVQAEKLLKHSPQKMHIGDYRVCWDNVKGELNVQLDPQLKHELKPDLIPSPKTINIPDIDAVAGRLKPKNKCTDDSESPNSKPSKPS